MHSDDSVRCLLPRLPGEGRDPVLPWAPAFQGVTQSRNLALSLSCSLFPRKREPRDFSRLLLGPRFRGDDEFSCPQDLLTASLPPGRQGGGSHRIIRMHLNTGWTPLWRI